MSKGTLFREIAEFVALVAAASMAAVILMAAAACVVGGRAPSPSPVSETAPARSPAATTEAVSVAGGNGEDVVLLEAQASEPVLAAPAAPASSVTQSALTATVTAYVVIDPVPATPPAQRVPVGSYAPWPPALWPMVECLIERESKGDAGAVGKAGERGLMQVHPITWSYLAQYGIAPDALFDPATNIRAGYLLYLEAGGLRPWGGTC